MDRWRGARPVSAPRPLNNEFNCCSPSNWALVQRLRGRRSTTGSLCARSTESRSRSLFEAKWSAAARRALPGIGRAARYADPTRRLPTWAWWSTARLMAWHVAITESRYYQPRVGFEPLSDVQGPGEGPLPTNRHRPLRLCARPERRMSERPVYDFWTAADAVEAVWLESPTASHATQAQWITKTGRRSLVAV